MTDVQAPPDETPVDETPVRKFNINFGPQHPADLGVEHPDQAAADRNLQAHQLLDGQHEGVLLVHRRDVVEAVEVADVLGVGPRFDQLLGAAVQQADVRVGLLDDLAVELQHQAQHAVRRRVLRPEVHGVVADLGGGRGSHQRGTCGSLSAGS